MQLNQLDALCSLVDKRTSRLRLILQLLREVGGIKGVHIVASCRPFEFKVDTRLQELNARRIDLALPSWVSISNILVSEGLNPSDYKGENQEVLRNPWNLKLFLQLSDPKPIHLSFYDLVDRVWEERIRTAANGILCRELVEILSEKIDETEEFWQPIAIGDGHVAEREHLEKEGILIKSMENRLVSFRHQTFYAYFLIRIFLRKSITIESYILSHNQSFFIRPTLVRALSYLRARGSGQYNDAIRFLLSDPEIRIHVRLLCIEFVGRQSEPTFEEQRLLKPYLQNVKVGTHVLRAVAESRGWFNLIANSDIFQKFWMRGSDSRIIVSMEVLERTVIFSEDLAIRLVIRNWEPDQKYDAYALRVIARAKVWNIGTIDCLIRYISHTSRVDAALLATAQLIRLCPKNATKAVGVIFRRVSRSVFALDYNSENNSPSFLNGHECLLWAWKSVSWILNNLIRYLYFIRVSSNSLREPLSSWPLQYYSSSPKEGQVLLSVKELLEENLYNYAPVTRVASSNPEGFLAEIWSEFEIGIKRCSKSKSSSSRMYIADYISDTQSLENVSGDGILSAVISAIKQMARSNPEKISSWIDGILHSESLCVHRLIVAGLSELPLNYADKAISYLANDMRRLLLGWQLNRTEDTCTLLDKFALHCSRPLIAKASELAFRIPNYFFEQNNNNDAEDSERKFRLFRKDRLAVLHAIGAKNCIYEEERKDLGDPLLFNNKRSAFSVVECSDSRVNAIGLNGMEMGNILALINQVPDDAESVMNTSGGEVTWTASAMTQANEFGKYVIDNAVTGKQILSELKAKIHEKYAAAALSYWANPSNKDNNSQKDLPPALAASELEEIALDLNKRGFSSKHFRETTARALQIVSRQNHGLTSDTTAMLKGWLSEVEWPGFGDESPGKTEKYERSILFSSFNSWSCPEGRAPIAEAVVLGGLMQRPPAIEQTIVFLEKFAQTERHPAVWADLLIHVPFLFGAESEKMTSIVDLLFSEIPTLLDYSQTYHFLARVIGNITPTEIERNWILSMIESRRPTLLQLAGELTFLSYAKNQASWSAGLIEKGSTDYYGTDFFRGLVYAASVYVSIDTIFDKTESVITRAFNSSDIRVTKAAADVLDHVDDKSWHDGCRQMTRHLLVTKKFNVKHYDTLSRQLELISLVDPEFALEAVNHMLPSIIKDKTYQSSLLAVSHLISISLNCQRETNLRNRGLELFETLLDLDVSDAREAANLLNDRGGGVRHKLK